MFNIECLVQSYKQSLKYYLKNRKASWKSLILQTRNVNTQRTADLQSNKGIIQQRDIKMIEIINIFDIAIAIFLLIQLYTEAPRREAFTLLGHRIAFQFTVREFKQYRAPHNQSSRLWYFSVYKSSFFVYKERRSSE